MSLYLGNLSPHVRRDELERVFRRFGPSNVRLKDGYGFVVYDFPGNAEKALWALRGKRICGEPISLTWSNMQPRGIQRFTKHSRFYEPYHRRKHTEPEDYGTRKNGSQNRKESIAVCLHPNSEGQAADMNDFQGKETGNFVDDIEREDHHNSKEYLLDETVATETNPLETDRWGVPVGNSLHDQAVENEANFDRYEPYHGYDKIYKDENQKMISYYGSPARENGQEKKRRELIQDATSNPPDNPKLQQVCYICGRKDHKMRYCPLRGANRSENFARIHTRHNDATFRERGEREPKRLRPVSLHRPPLTEDRQFSRHIRKSSRTLKMIGTTESSLVNKEIRQSQHVGRESDRKRQRMEQGSSRNNHGRQSKRSSSSPHCSGSTASNSSSPSQLPEINTCSRSQSMSSKTSSISSSSRSISTSSHSRSQSSRSRSKSRSPMSPSISLNRRLPSPPPKMQMEGTVTSLKGYLENDTSFDSKKTMIEQRQVVESVSTLDNYRPKGTNATIEDESILPSFKVQGEINKNHAGQQEEMNHARQIEENGYDSLTGMHHEVKSRCTTPEKSFSAEENLPSENSRERNDLQKSGWMTMQQIQASEIMSHTEVPSRIKNSSSITSQEAYMALKHYGLKVPEENENNLAVEDFFGSASLWPWEVIYYRRLKKGPISTENYARRIAQNTEFGIVDKYIRSSSGWGEFESLNFN